MIETMEKPAPTLTQLVGLPLKISRHAGNMLVLHFGRIRRSTGARGPESWGDLAIHVQCPWRVTAAGNLLFGSADRWRPAEGVEVEDWDAWWESPHPNREDRGWERLLGGKDEATRSFECPDNSILVTEVHASGIGDLKIVFSSAIVLDIFANGSDHEFWRLLAPADHSDHLVCPSEAEN
jgi:hypothetical protein